jgi:hypothetical protein
LALKNLKTGDSIPFRGKELVVGGLVWWNNIIILFNPSKSCKED